MHKNLWEWLQTFNTDLTSVPCSNFLKRNVEKFSKNHNITRIIDYVCGKFYLKVLKINKVTVDLIIIDFRVGGHDIYDYFVCNRWNYHYGGCIVTFPANK